MSKKKHSTPNIPAATVLRLRLEGLWQNPSLPTQPAEQIENDLQTLARNSKPDQFIVVLLNTFQGAPSLAREHLEKILPNWLARQPYLELLEELLPQRKVSGEAAIIAQRWLTAAGRGVGIPEDKRQSTFHSAYHISDEWQSALIILWYSNPQRTRASGIQFLIDRNPPWHGSLKDIIALSTKMPQQLKERYVDIWEKRGQAMKPLSAAEAKRIILTALKDNQTAHIRIPREFVALREQFFEHVLTLPDTPATPHFTLEDFHTISQTGRAAEEVMRFEEKVGRRIIAADGKEIFIGADLANTMMELDREGWENADDE